MLLTRRGASRQADGLSRCNKKAEMFGGKDVLLSGFCDDRSNDYVIPSRTTFAQRRAVLPFQWGGRHLRHQGEPPLRRIGRLG